MATRDMADLERKNNLLEKTNALISSIKKRQVKIENDLADLKTELKVLKRFFSPGRSRGTGW